MNRPALPVALQLWSIREQVAADFPGTLAEVARLGFQGVELAGLGQTDVGQANQVLRDHGLRVAGMHIHLDQLRNQFTQVLEHALLLGSPNIICPWYPPALLRSASAFVALGEELNTLGAQLRAYGLALHYHHHDFELKVFDGRTGLDWLLDASEPRNVGCETDVYWLKVGGLSPERFLHEQGRRIRLVHLKDEYEIGGGPVDFDPVFTAIDTIGAAEWLILEQEKYHFPPLEAVAKSLEQLRRWGRA